MYAYIIVEEIIEPVVMRIIQINMINVISGIGLGFSWHDVFQTVGKFPKSRVILKKKKNCFDFPGKKLNVVDFQWENIKLFPYLLVQNVRKYKMIALSGGKIIWFVAERNKINNSDFKTPPGYLLVDPLHSLNLVIPNFCLFRSISYRFQGAI